MKLKRIEIENFKCVGERQCIDLRPITLLFGPNSAGKSTILQALQYVREILENENVDPSRTVAGGLVDLGGFAKFVHNHDLDRTISIKLSLELARHEGIGKRPLILDRSFPERKFARLPIRYLQGNYGDHEDDIALVKEISLQVNVKWHEDEQRPYVDRLSVELNDAHLASIIPKPGLKMGFRWSEAASAYLTDFNFGHPLLQDDARQDMSSGVHEKDADTEPCEGDTGSALECEICTLSKMWSPENRFKDGRLRIEVDTVYGALPEMLFGIEMGLGNPLGADDDNSERVGDLEVLLNELFMGPVLHARDYLMQTTYIGPLREIPQRGYRPQLHVDESRWSKGIAAYDLLFCDKFALSGVNRRLSSCAESLGTPYQVERVEIREIPASDSFHAMLDSKLDLSAIENLRERYLELPTRVEILLRDMERDILVAPCDVGVGISQLIPVIAALSRDKEGILCVEQPELHLHPAAQVCLGDMFIEAKYPVYLHKKTLLIETHSEHIILRLLRRVRETSDGELPSKGLQIKPDDLSVIYVEKTTEGIRFKPLRVSRDGDFIDPWPKGFFDERAEELF